MRRINNFTIMVFTNYLKPPLESDFDAINLNKIRPKSQKSLIRIY
jgi:hypothetical protein